MMPPMTAMSELLRERRIAEVQLLRITLPRSTLDKGDRDRLAYSTKTTPKAVRGSEGLGGEGGVRRSVNKGRLADTASRWWLLSRQTHQMYARY